jgi:hypothetical protein
MSALQGFDLVLLFSSSLLRDLIVGTEQKFQEIVDSAIQDVPANTEEVIEETLANFSLFVPRLLFATKNPAYPSGFSCPPAAGEGGEELLARLQAHRDLGQFDDGVLRPHRLTFLRPEFFDADRPVPLAFDSGRLKITLEGRVHLGRRFSRSRAAASADTFAMDLLYEPRLLPTEPFGVPGKDKLLGVTSYAVTNDKVATPPLPPLGFPIYVKAVTGLVVDAQGKSHLRPKFVLPDTDDFPAPACDHTEQVRGEERRSRVELFRGQVGEQIFVSERASQPRFEVRLQLFPDLRLLPVLVDLDQDERVVAMGQGFARAVMQLRGIENLRLRIDGDLNPFSAKEMAAICRSLVKVNPFSPFARLDLISDTIEQAKALRLLDVFGSLDFLFLPLVSQFFFNPRIEEGEEFVRTDARRIQFAPQATRVMDDVVAVAGDLEGSELGNISALADFSTGLDLTFGFSQDLLQAMLLDPLNRSIQNTLECQDDIQQAQVQARLVAPDATHPRGAITVTASGSGTYKKELLFLTLDVDFAFRADFALGLELYHAIMRKTFYLDADGQEVDPGDPQAIPATLPVDAYGNRIPAPALDILGIQAPDFTTPDPRQNPVCFEGYCDPRRLGIDPVPLSCLAPVTPPPVVDETGTEVAPPAAEDPDSACRSQVDFGGPVVHAKEITFRLPRNKDEITFDIDVDLGLFAHIVLIVLGALSLGLTGGLVAYLLPTIIGEAVKLRIGEKTKRQLGSQATSTRMPLINLTLDLLIGLVSYAEDAEIQDGAFIIRNRTLLDPQDESSGFEGLGV